VRHTIPLAFGGEVLDFALAMLRGTLLPTAILSEMRKRQSPTRAVGWEIRHAGWSGGDRCSAGTIGHTGFTGTGLWIDWRRGLAWALLTNRVHPSRHVETGISELRQQTGDILASAALAKRGPPAVDGVRRRASRAQEARAGMGARRADR
jgi:CubicO group peptidase (beta-lactamase class C family)